MQNLVSLNLYLADVDAALATLRRVFAPMVALPARQGSESTFAKVHSDPCFRAAAPASRRTATHYGTRSKVTRSVSVAVRSVVPGTMPSTDVRSTGSPSVAVTVR